MIGWIAKFSADVHGPKRLKLTDFGDPLTFPTQTSVCDYNNSLVGIMSNELIHCEIKRTSHLSGDCLEAH